MIMPSPTARRRHLILLLWLALSVAALTARAQSIQGDPTDLRFEVVNATTGAPGTVERMTIEYVSGRRNGILDFHPSGSAFVAPGVPVKEIGRYIVAVWHQGVPYWWNIRGQKLLSGTTVLHVFDTTASLDGVSISGLNLVLRHQDSLLHLEYMLQVENTTTPQQTVFDQSTTFELDFPAGAEHVDATYQRGPDPTAFPASTHGTSRLRLTVPLTPGSNHIRLVADIPWQEGMTVPVGSNLAIAAWRVLGTPAWLEVDSTEMEAPDRTSTPGFSRWPGPALTAGRSVDLRLASGEHQSGTAENLFTRTESLPAGPDSLSRSGPEKADRPTLPVVFGGLLVIIVVVTGIRRRRKKTALS